MAHKREQKGIVLVEQTCEHYKKKFKNIGKILKKKRRNKKHERIKRR